VGSSGVVNHRHDGQPLDFLDVDRFQCPDFVDSDAFRTGVAGVSEFCRFIRPSSGHPGQFGMVLRQGAHCCRLIYDRNSICFPPFAWRAHATRGIASRRLTWVPSIAQIPSEIISDPFSVPFTPTLPRLIEPFCSSACIWVQNKHFGTNVDGFR